MKTSPNNIVRRSVSTLIGLVLGVWLITAIGVYGFHWHGSRTTMVTRWTPLPAASVGWHPLSVFVWLMQYQAISRYHDQLTQTSQVAFPIHTSEQNARDALSKIIQDRGLATILRDMNITISTADIDQAFQAQLNQTGKPDQITATLKRLYDWTPTQYKRFVIWSVVARDRLQEKLSFDEHLNTSARQQADKVLALLKSNSSNFEDVAKSYSDDAYGAKGGDLGFVPKGTQLKELDEVSFSLPLNQISDLIHTKYGFHILKVTERKTVDGQEQAHVFQILVAAPSVDQYVTDWLKHQHVRVWMNGYSWDNNRGQVTID